MYTIPNIPASLVWALLGKSQDLNCAIHALESHENTQPSLQASFAATTLNSCIERIPLCPLRVLLSNFFVLSPLCALSMKVLKLAGAVRLNICHRFQGWEQCHKHPRTMRTHTNCVHKVCTYICYIYARNMKQTRSLDSIDHRGTRSN